MNKPATANSSIENLFDDMNSGKLHVDSGRQARSAILERKHKTNIQIHDQYDECSSILSENDIEDREALMFMINENLS